MSHSTALGDGAPAPVTHTFERKLGVGSIVFMVVAAAAPLTVVGGTVPLVFAMSDNSGVPAYYLVAALTLTVFAVGFTAMTPFVRNAGAFYSYIQAGLGRIAGIGSATLALFAYFVLLLAVYAYCGAATGNALDHFLGIDTPWWLWTGATVLLVAYLGYRNIELSSKVLGLLLIAEAAVVVIVNVAVIAQGGEAGLSLSTFAPAEVAAGSPGIGLMFAFFGFIGFEATAVFRDETKDPERTIPRATYIAVISIGLFYSVSAWAIAMATGTSEVVAASAADPEGLFIQLANVYVLPVLGDIIQVLLVTSLFACVLAFHNVVTRYQYALGRQQVLPVGLSAIHPQHRSPSRSSMVLSTLTASALLVVALVGLDPVTQVYAWFSGAATLGLMLLMALTMVAVLVFFSRQRLGLSAWRTVVAPAAALVALVAVTILVLNNFTMLVGSSILAVVMTCAVALSFGVGTVIAVRMRARRAAVYEELGTAIEIPQPAQL